MMIVLNVPVHGMDDLVLNVGGCSGAEIDKVEALNIALCSPGEQNLPDSDAFAQPKKQKLSNSELYRREIAKAHAKSIAVRDCVAHLLCRVDNITEDDGHFLLRCSQLAGWCNENYWNGRNFFPQTPETAPYLTFLGTKTFACVTSSTGG
jgi:hypothetical protein